MIITGEPTEKMVKLEFSYMPQQLQKGAVKEVAFFYFKEGASKFVI